MTTIIRPFHLAFPVDDLEVAYEFYTSVLGCGVGRRSEGWIDFDFFGHQLVAHLSPQDVQAAKRNEVDGDHVPARHFGVILEWNQWHDFRNRLVEHNITFLIEPHIRFKDKAGEQATLFFLDPAGNALEFKAFKDDGMIFAV